MSRFSPRRRVTPGGWHRMVQSHPSPRVHPREHWTLNQWRGKGGPASATLARHCTVIGWRRVFRGRVCDVWWSPDLDLAITAGRHSWASQLTIVADTMAWSHNAPCDWGEHHRTRHPNTPATIWPLEINRGIPGIQLTTDHQHVSVRCWITVTLNQAN